jgi:hypothetical protein
MQIIADLADPYADKPVDIRFVFNIIHAAFQIDHALSLITVGCENDRKSGKPGNQKKDEKQKVTFGFI